MSYIKTTWVNGVTPINATNLNHIEDGIEGVENNKQSVYNLETDGEEIKLGYQIDGKDVYAKRYTLPSLANSTQVAHGLSNFELIDYDVMTYASGVYRKLNYSATSYYVIDVESTYFKFYTNGTLSGTGKVTLYYVYNS